MASPKRRLSVAGFALFFHNYSTFLGKPGIWLEDLFVRPEHRGARPRQGAARRAGAESPSSADAGGSSGRVLDWNEPSIDFYRSLGAEAMDEWTTYRLTGDALDDLARGVSPTSNI